MENAFILQDWKTDNKCLERLFEKIKIEPEYDESRLDEYQNAILVILYRLPIPLIFIGFNAAEHKYTLMQPNSIYEAYVHFINNRFQIHNKYYNGFYKDLDRPAQRIITDTTSISAQIFWYVQEDVYTQVKNIISKFKM